MAIKEKFKIFDIHWLIYIPVIIGIAAYMAFCRDKQLDHLSAMAFIWSVLVILSGQIRIDAGDILIFSGMMTFMWMYRGWFVEGLAYAFMCTVIYQLGKIISGDTNCYGSGARNSDDTRERVFTRIVYMITTLATALLIRGLLNYRYVIKWKSKTKTFRFRTRIEKDLYGETFVRTEQAFYLVLMATILIFFVYIIRKSAAIGLFGIILSCIAIRLDLFTRGRMVLCCTIVTTLVVLVAAGIEKKLYKRRWIQITGAVAAVLFLGFIIMVGVNAFGLYDWYQNSFWQRGGGILHNIRFEIMKNAFMEMIEHPLTGSNEALFMTERVGIAGMAHNSWLDIGKQSGVIPFVLTVAFTVTNAVSLFMIWKKCDNVYKYILIAGFIGVTLYNMFEPAILNFFLFWNTEVFLGGMVNGLCISTTGRREWVISLRDKGNT